MRRRGAYKPGGLCKVPVGLCFCLGLVFFYCFFAACLAGPSRVYANPSGDAPDPTDASGEAVCVSGQDISPASNRPEWPHEFGKPVALARAARRPGYKGLVGPDSNIWCVTVSHPDPSRDSRSTLVVTRVDPDMRVLGAVEVEPVQGEVVAFDAAVLGDGVLFFWAERRGDDYLVFLKRVLFRPDLPASLQPLDAWAFPAASGSVQDVAVAVSGDLVFFGWVDQAGGRPGAFISSVDARTFRRNEGEGAGQVEGELSRLERIRVSGPDVSVTAVSLVPAPDGVWVAWVESGQILNRVMFCPYLKGRLGSAVQIIQTGSAGLQGISPMVTADGLCHVVFTKGRISQGNVRRPSVVYGVLDREGNWAVEPQYLTQGEGDAEDPSAVLAGDAIAVAWSDNRSGKFQIHHALVRVADVSGLPGGTGSRPLSVLTCGAATLSTKECFFPQILAFDDGTRAILYQVYLTEGDIQVLGVSSRNPVPPGWAYYLGLDLERPLQDGVYKTVTALALSFLYIFLALPSLAVALGLTLVADRFNVFSDTAIGARLRSLFLFGCVFLLKRPGVWYYAYAPVLPEGLGWLSFSLASLAVLCLDIQSLSHRKDVLATTLSGALYVFFDSLFCTVLKGVGVA